MKKKNTIIGRLFFLICVIAILVPTLVFAAYDICDKVNSGYTSVKGAIPTVNLADLKDASKIYNTKNYKYLLEFPGPDDVSIDCTSGKGLSTIDRNGKKTVVYELPYADNANIDGTLFTVTIKGAAKNIEPPEGGDVNHDVKITVSKLEIEKDTYDKEKGKGNYLMLFWYKRSSDGKYSPWLVDECIKGAADNWAPLYPYGHRKIIKRKSFC